MKSPATHLNAAFHRRRNGAMYPSMLRALATFCAVWLVCTLSAQGSVLTVDFGPGSLQSGYSANSSPNAGVTYPTSAGDITVTTSSVEGQYNRGSLNNSGAFTYASLHIDYFYHKTADIELTLSGPGITANRDYQLRFYSWDNYDPSTATYNTEKEIDMVYTPISATVGSALTVTYLLSSDAPAANDTYSATGIFTSNNSGELTFSIGSETDGYPRAYINGLELDFAPVPEPGTAALLLTGFGLIAWVRRMRVHA